METVIPLVFRCVIYTILGLTMEVIGAVLPIEWSLGFKLKRRVPFKYLEGFVSLYMFPLHGFGVLFLYEPVRDLMAGQFIGLRYVVYALLITSMEISWGFAQHKVLGFFTWDYYRDSRFRIGKNGYSLWTLVPFWGVAGMVLEPVTDLMRYLSPYVTQYFLG